MDAPYLNELETFKKALKGARYVTSDTYRDIAGVDVPDLATFIVGIVKACMSAPLQSKSAAKLFKSDELGSIKFGGDRNEKAKKANAMMLQARAFIEQHGMDVFSPSVSIIVGMFDVRMVTYVFEKTFPNRPTFKSMLEVCGRFCDEFKAAHDGVKGSPWPLIEMAASSAGSSAQCSTRVMRELDVRGGITLSAVNAAGFDVGKVVQSSGDSYNSYNIVSFQEGQATLEHKEQADAEPWHVDFEVLMQMKIITIKDKVDTR